MIDSRTQDQPNWRVVTILTWAMLVVAPAVYLIIALFVDAKGMQAPAGNDVVFYILFVVALTDPLLAFIIEPSEIGKFKAGKSAAKTAGNLFLTVSIVKMAMVEAVYIFGLVSYLVTGRLDYMLYFYPLGILWSYVHWPRREKFTRLLEELNRP
ncbi:MAG: hypothetical protein AB1772_09885 [Candidatus Zixiibacteriota bacterium]